MTRVDDQPRESTKCWRQSRKLCPKLDNVIIKCLTMFHFPPSPSRTHPSFTLYTCFLVSFFSYAILQLFLSMHFSFFLLFSTWEFFTRQRKRGQNYATPSSRPLFVCLLICPALLLYQTIRSSSYHRALSTSFQFVSAVAAFNFV